MLVQHEDVLPVEEKIGVQVPGSTKRPILELLEELCGLPIGHSGISYIVQETEGQSQERMEQGIIGRGLVVMTGECVDSSIEAPGTVLDCEVIPEQFAELLMLRGGGQPLVE